MMNFNTFCENCENQQLKNSVQVFCCTLVVKNSCVGMGNEFVKFEFNNIGIIEHEKRF